MITEVQLAERVDAFLGRCEWVHQAWYGDRWALKTPRGRTCAEVYKSLSWHTWDRHGVGGENASASTLTLAKEAVVSALRRQMIAVPRLWHVCERAPSVAPRRHQSRARPAPMGTTNGWTVFHVQEGE